MTRLACVFSLLFAVFGYAVPLPEHHRVFPPFISGDAFRTYCDFAYDTDTEFEPAEVMHGSAIFVQAVKLKDFFEKIHPHIPYKYILITHNSDDEVPGPFKEFLDDPKIGAWFGENWDGYAHPKMRPIPMGMATMSWPNGNGDSIRKVRDAHVEKEHLVHMGFTIQTNYKERWEVFRLFSQSPFMYRTIKKTFEKYLFDVAASKFEIAPKGFAWDTYRLWECIYVGTIPIVKTSQLDVLYEDLPVLIVQDWKEITEDFLNEKYQEMSFGTYNMEKSTIDYWLKLIDEEKARL